MELVGGRSHVREGTEWGEALKRNEVLLEMYVYDRLGEDQRS